MATDKKAYERAYELEDYETSTGGNTNTFHFMEPDHHKKGSTTNKKITSTQ